jgi:hypothetical protein
MDADGVDAALAGDREEGSSEEGDLLVHGWMP